MQDKGGDEVGGSGVFQPEYGGAFILCTFPCHFFPLSAKLMIYGREAG